MPFLFLQNIASSILNDIGMRISFYFRKQLNLLPKDKLRLLIIKSDFFNALDVTLLIGNLINYTVSSTNHLSHFELFVQILVSAHELYYFIAHYIRNSIPFLCNNDIQDQFQSSTIDFEQIEILVQSNVFRLAHNTSARFTSLSLTSFCFIQLESAVFGC